MNFKTGKVLQTTHCADSTCIQSRYFQSYNGKIKGKRIMGLLILAVWPLFYLSYNYKAVSYKRKRSVYPYEK